MLYDLLFFHQVLSCGKYNTCPLINARVNTRDITEIKEAEKSLRSLKQFNEDLIDNSPFGISIYNIKSGQCVECNQSMADLVGATKEQILSQKYRDIEYWKRSGLLNVADSAILNKKVLHRKAEVVTSFGKRITIDCHFAPFISDSHRYLMVTALDVSRREVAEKELKKSEQKFRTIFQSSTAGIVISALEDGSIIEFNDAMSAITGYDPEESIGKSSVDIGFWQNRADRETITNQLKKEGKFHSIEFDFFRKDGQRRTGMFSCEVVSIDGSPSIITTMFDISDLRQAEKALQESQSELLLKGKISDILLLKEGDQIYKDVLPLILEELGSEFGFFGFINDAGDLECPSLTDGVWDECTLPDKSIVFQKTSWTGLWGQSLNEKKIVVANRSLNLPKGHVPLSNALASPITHEGDLLGQIVVANKASDYDSNDIKKIVNISTFIAPLLQNVINKNEKEILRQQVEKSILKERALLRAIIDNIPVMLTHYDPDSNMLFLNNEFEKNIGWKTSEVQDINMMEHVYPDPGYRERAIEYMMQASSEWREFSVVAKTGETVLSEWSNIKMEDGTQIGIGIDIRERRQREADLNKHVKTQEVLFREVNHRVKNNLSAIMSVLYKEKDKAEANHANQSSEILTDLLTRIESLSTVHSLLSLSGWQPLLLSNLCDKLIHATLQGLLPITNFSVDVSESQLKVSSNQAHHLALVINELTTNSIKHGSRDREGVNINVGINSLGNMTKIVFMDNGPGYPKDIIERGEHKSGIGMELISGITIDSLAGDVQVYNDNGAVTVITFNVSEE